MFKSPLPLLLNGTVVKGFGRGSKELGIPTANLDENVVNSVSSSLENGIYYGFAQVDDSCIHKMVMSIGWNPYYKNNKRTVEVHILHKFDDDFYGSMLKIVAIGYIRAEKNFSSKEELINEIQNDISIACNKLDDTLYNEYQKCSLFTSGITDSLVCSSNGTDKFLSDSEIYPTITIGYMAIDSWLPRFFLMIVHFNARCSGIPSITET